MANRKGERRERELVNELDDHGFAVMRAPASGSATERDLPDVLAGNGDDFYAIEAKSSSGDPIYIAAKEIESLEFFSNNFGAEAKVGIRFDREDWAFFSPDEIYKTDSGKSYRVKEEDLHDGEDLDELSGDHKQTNLSDH